MILHKHCPCGCFNSFENQKDDFIKEFDHWLLYLHFRQHFFGRCLLILKKHKINMSELSNTEVVEFLNIYKKWENAVSELSNNSNYNTEIVISNTEHHIHNSHMHWHFIPLYENIVTFADNSFQADTKKRKGLSHNKIEIKKITEPELRKKIASAIKKLL